MSLPVFYCDSGTTTLLSFEFIFVDWKIPARRRRVLLYSNLTNTTSKNITSLIKIIIGLGNYQECQLGNPSITSIPDHVPFVDLSSSSNFPSLPST